MADSFLSRGTVFLLLAGANFADGKIAASACPPSCATNELLELLDNYCSDKARERARQTPALACHAGAPPRGQARARARMGACCSARVCIRPLTRASRPAPARCRERFGKASITTGPPTTPCLDRFARR